MLEPEVVGHPHEISGAVQQGGLRPGVRVAITGPVDADETRTLPANPFRVVEGHVAVQTRSRGSVADEHGRPLGISPGGVPYGPPVVGLEQMILADTVRHLSVSPRCLPPRKLQIDPLDANIMPSAENRSNGRMGHSFQGPGR